MRMARSLQAAALVSLLQVGCNAEVSVDIDLRTAQLDGAVVSSSQIVMTEGQAVGILVTAQRDDEPQPDWSVEADIDGVGVASVRETQQERVFVVSAEAPGQTTIRFRIEAARAVDVPVVVKERSSWVPRASEPDLGLGGMPGASGG